ncbi:Protein of unknown function [Streptococcus thermophilus]|nr:Protein of unknown function [Streptococcus thermophilus]
MTMQKRNILGMSDCL